MADATQIDVQVIRRRLPWGYEGPRWCAYWWFVGWDCLSLGVSLCWSKPNVEVHLPFGFIRIGRV